MDGWTDGRMDGWTDGRTDGWMDGWHLSLSLALYLSPSVCIYIKIYGYMYTCVYTKLPADETVLLVLVYYMPMVPCRAQSDEGISPWQPAPQPARTAPAPRHGTGVTCGEGDTMLNPNTLILNTLIL